MAELSKEEEAIFNELISKYNLNKQQAAILARDNRLYNFFIEALNEYSSPITIANFVTNEVAKLLKEESKLKFSPKDIASLAKMADSEIISNKIAKEVFDLMSKSGDNPELIVEKNNLKQISNPNELLPIIKDIIAKNQDKAQQYKNGNQKLFGFFVGQVLKATNGKANPKIVNQLVKKSLDNK